MEYFRVAASSLINRNTQGNRAWERVVASTLKAKRIDQLLKELRKGVKPVRIHTPGGSIAASEIPARADVITRVLARLTLGLLRLTHPEVDTLALDFEVTQIHQFKLRAIVSSGVAAIFTHYGVGDGVYRHWRALSNEDSRRGMWVHVFYGAAAWMVVHKEGTGIITLHGAPGWEQRLR